MIDRFKNESAWDKYKDIVIPLGAFVLCFLITFFFFKEVGAGLNNLAGSFSGMSAECSKLIGR